MPTNYDFAVYFTVEGKKLIIEVEPPTGQTLKTVAPISKDPLMNVNQLDFLIVAHKPNNSPCCVVWDGKKYCWC